MSLSRGASRLFRALKFGFTWPTHVEVEPFFVVDMEWIPAFRERNHGTGTWHPCMFDDSDIEIFSRRWSARFNTLEDLARGQAENVMSLTYPPQNATMISVIPMDNHQKAMADKDAVEAAIRREADPEGRYSRTLIDTAGLVKNIRKRHRDALAENKRDKNAMRIAKEDLQHVKDRLRRMIEEKNEAELQEAQLNNDQDQHYREDFAELQNKYHDLLADKKAKDGRIAELEGLVKTERQMGEHAQDESAKALARAESQMQLQIKCIESKHKEEMDVLRGWKKILEDQVKRAEKVDKVHEMHETLLQMKKAKAEELSVKQDEIRGLKTRIDKYERKINCLEAVAKTDGENLQKTADLLRDTQNLLKNSEEPIGSLQGEAETLNRRATVWKSTSLDNLGKIGELEMELLTLKTAQRTELMEVKAKNEGLQASRDFFKAASDKMDLELEAWENRCTCRQMVSNPEMKVALPGTVAESLAKALKAANTRADALQVNVNSLRAENETWHKLLQSGAYSGNAQAKEQVERLQTENRDLSKAAAEAEMLKEHLKAQFRMEIRSLEQLFADKTQELELGFDQGFKYLCALRDQWLVQKRRSEEEHYKQMVAADEQQKIIWKEKEQNLQHMEHDLQRRKNDLATQESSLHSSGDNLLQMKLRAGKAEEDVRKLEEAASDDKNNQTSGEAYLNIQIESLRRDRQRNLDLLNEEISKMEPFTRQDELHTELQTANTRMYYFKCQVDGGETNSEALSQGLYGADFSESDVDFLREQGREKLLAQLQGARKTLEGLRNGLVKGPNVDVDTIISLLLSPRGDGDTAAVPAEDCLSLSNKLQQPGDQQPGDQQPGDQQPGDQQPGDQQPGDQQPGDQQPGDQQPGDQQPGDQQPGDQSSFRKRKEAPLGAPIYSEHDENGSSHEEGDQTVDAGAGISTPQEILNRRRFLPKSRRNAGPAITVAPKHVVPALRDH